MHDRDDARTVEPEETAREAGLRYVSDEDPGIRRRRCGRGFTYLDAKGRTIRSADTRARIEELAVPPAWEDVWIAPREDAHILATGRDEEGRKQYIYHPRWRIHRDMEKYRRVAALGPRLPALRQRLGRDLSRSGLPLPRVAAGAVRLLDRAALRVGNEAYTVDNESFGITTLRRHHVRLTNGHVRFRFEAKGGQERDVVLRDAPLAKLVTDLRRVPGECLFVFRSAPDREPAQLRPEHVNDYLRSALRTEVTAKDFRTWAGSVEALRVLCGALDVDEEPRPEAVLEAVDTAAEALGNLRATAREFYVHPGLLAAYEAGALRTLIDRADAAAERPGFRAGEGLLLALLPALEEYVETG